VLGLFKGLTPTLLREVIDYSDLSIHCKSTKRLPVLRNG
jgi:hypothetical protein